MSASSGTTGASLGLRTVFTRDTPELAATYDRISVHQFESGKRLISDLNISSGEDVLDIGAGTGRLATYVAKLVAPSGRVVGIDPLALRIKIAQSKAVDNFEASVGQAEDLSEFADGSFDVVYMNSVFHWVEDKPRAMAEIFRVLKPNGRLGLNCQDLAHPHEAFDFIRCAFMEAGMELGHLIEHRSVSLLDDELEALVTGAGFAAYECELRSFVDLYPGIDDLLAWMSSSSFGNSLVNVSEVDLASLRRVLAQLLEAKRPSGGAIRLERYLAFVAARKPR